MVVTDRGDVFFYKDGYIRTSSEEYTLDSNLNYVHLTNNCLQVYGKNYGKHEEGNTLAFSVLQQYLDEEFPALNVSLAEHILPRIKDLILDTIFSVKHRLVVPVKKRLCNFELLGYDFMIDEDFRVWLIEINSNPYLGIPNPYIAGVLPHMLDNLFSLVLDPVYPSKSEKVLPNNFELLFCEKDSLYSSAPINTRRSYKKDYLYPVKECGPVQPETKAKKRAQMKKPAAAVHPAEKSPERSPEGKKEVNANANADSTNNTKKSGRKSASPKALPQLPRVSKSIQSLIPGLKKETHTPKTKARKDLDKSVSSSTESGESKYGKKHAIPKNPRSLSPVAEAPASLKLDDQAREAIRMQQWETLKAIFGKIVARVVSQPQSSQISEADVINVLL